MFLYIITSSVECDMFRYTHTHTHTYIYIYIYIYIFWVLSLVLLPADGSRPLKHVGKETCERSGKVYPTTGHECPRGE